MGVFTRWALRIGLQAPRERRSRRLFPSLSLTDSRSIPVPLYLVAPPFPYPFLAPFSRTPRWRAASRLRYFGTQRGLPADIRKYRERVFRNPFVRSVDREGKQWFAAPGRRELQTRSGAGFAEQVHVENGPLWLLYCPRDIVL